MIIYKSAKFVLNLSDGCSFLIRSSFVCDIKSFNPTERFQYILSVFFPDDAFQNSMKRLLRSQIVELLSKAVTAFTWIKLDQSPSCGVNASTHWVRWQTLWSWWESLCFGRAGGRVGWTACWCEGHSSRAPERRRAEWTGRSRCGTAPDTADSGRAAPLQCCSHPSNNSWCASPGTDTHIH